MHGWIQQCIEALILEKFGPDVWDKIREECGCTSVPVGGFVRHEEYSDEFTLQLVGAVGKVLGLEVGKVLEVFGDFFITWLVAQGYGLFLKSQGRHLLEFLQNIDSMHTHLRVGMPRLMAPSLKCKVVSGEGGGEKLILTYITHRAGLQTIIFGILTALGRELFVSEYEVEMQRSWTDEAKLNYTDYSITLVKGRPLSRVPDPGEAEVRFAHCNRGQFFLHNPNMAQGWVGALAAEVGRLTTETAAQWGQEFDLPMLTSLLETHNTHAEMGITCLFVRPFKAPGSPLPVPTFGYLPPGGGIADQVRGLCFPQLVMHSDVTFGPHALVHSCARSGWHQVPVDVRVCVVPNIHQSLHVLRAVYDAPNDNVVASPLVGKIVTMSWLEVRPRLALNMLVDAAQLALVAGWALAPDRGFPLWWLLIVAFAKELSEEALQISGYARRQWLRKYLFTGGNIFDAVRLVLHLVLLVFIALEGPLGIDRITIRFMVGFFACHRCWRLLFHCRAFQMFGPRVLPIILAVQSLGPFSFVLFMVVLGFAFLFVSVATLSEPQSSVYVSMLQAGLVEISDSLGGHEWMEGWLYVVAIAVGIILINILISILSESYDLHQDNSYVLYHRELALLTCNLRFCMWPRKVGSGCSSWWSNMLTVECPERAGVHSNKYLWVSLAETVGMMQSRLRNMKDHVSLQCEGIRQDLRRMEKRLGALEGHIGCPMLAASSRGSLEGVGEEGGSEPYHSIGEAGKSAPRLKASEHNPERRSAWAAACASNVMS